MTTRTRKKPTQVMFADDNDVEINDTPSNKQVVDTSISHSPDHMILDLPSKGKFGYPSSVEYRDILAKDEEVLVSTTADTYARTLNGVLKGILNNCSFFEQLCVHDRDYVLIWLWANNYTPRKTLEINCKHCKHVDTHTVDMTQLDVTDPHEKLTGAFQFDLKKTGKPVKVRLSTVGDENQVETFISERPEMKDKFEFLMMVASVDVGMNITFERKLDWVRENVSGKEMAIIKEFHKRYSYGVRTKLQHTCTKCEGVTDFALPFQVSEFLFPTPELDELEFNFV